MKSLEVAIEKLYSAFSYSTPPEKIDGCSHCLNDEEVAKLISTPLREISPDEISSYASSAFLTVGDVTDYLYFLPRIMEISVNDLWWWPDIEVTGQAIGNTNPHGWAENRREAIFQFLSSAIKRFIETEDHDNIDRWMCAIARAGFDVRPYLEIVETSPEAVSNYIVMNERMLAKGKLSNAFWELPNEGHDMIMSWMRNEKTLFIARNS